MTTHFIFPKPKDWNTFEDIVCDVFARKFGEYNLQRYGRSGQRQSGVDIAGFIEKGVIGIQCKHHPEGNIALSEIDDEITKSEGFRPTLDEFIIVTSADRDVTAHSHVLQTSENRQSTNRFPVGIKFWEDIFSWLVEFPDLVYKHFTKYFPIQDLEDIHISTLQSHPKSTLCWPLTPESLQDTAIRNVGGLDKVEPYRLTVGITNFPDVSYAGLVDVEISLARLLEDELSPEANFVSISEILSDFKAVIKDPFFSNQLQLYLQTRLTTAFLIGWVFRRVSHFDLKLVFNNQVWTTSGLPLVPSGISDGLPVLGFQNSDEVVVVMSISRNIEASVIDFVDSWNPQPRAILIYDLEGNYVTSAAHALSIAIEVSGKLKTLIDKWQVRKIHLFGAMPAALATLISFHLNAICPISIYFLDSSRTKYKVGGTLVNTL